MLVRTTAELEKNIVSVERVKEYTETRTEAPWKIYSETPDPTWPSEGRIVLENYKMRYREGMDLALRGVNVDISGGEKVHIEKVNVSQKLRKY